MSNDWEVAQANGQRIDLERGSERCEIRKPRDPDALAIFRSIRAGEFVDEHTAAMLLRSE